MQRNPNLVDLKKSNAVLLQNAPTLAIVAVHTAENEPNVEVKSNAITCNYFYFLLQAQRTIEIGLGQGVVFPPFEGGSLVNRVAHVELSAGSLKPKI